MFPVTIIPNMFVCVNQKQTMMHVSGECILRIVFKMFSSRKICQCFLLSDDFGYFSDIWCIFRLCVLTDWLLITPMHKKDQKLIKTCIEMPFIYVTLYFTQVTITKQTAKNELDWKIKHNLWRRCESTGVTLFSDTDLFSYSLVSSNYRLQIY